MLPYHKNITNFGTYTRLSLLNYTAQKMRFSVGDFTFTEENGNLQFLCNVMYGTYVE